MLLIGAVITLVGLTALYLQNYIRKNKVYVYPITKQQYYVKGIVRMRDITSPVWVDAILYVSLRDGQFYVREKDEFFNKFITLKQWKKRKVKEK